MSNVRNLVTKGETVMWYRSDKYSGTTPVHPRLVPYSLTSEELRDLSAAASEIADYMDAVALRENIEGLT